MAQVGGDHLAPQLAGVTRTLFVAGRGRGSDSLAAGHENLSGETGEGVAVGLSTRALSGRPSNLISVPGGCRPGAGI